MGNESLSSTVVMAFQRIPPGPPFLMGSRGYSDDEEPRHLVTITDAFYLGTFPATQSQFGVWTNELAIEHENRFAGRSDNPAENLDWWQALDFCLWLNRTRSSELPPGYCATLPTEAEWECACRAGTDTEYYTGDGETALREAGWFGEAYDSGSTHPVGDKARNQFGLSDMHGNVWEWCWDFYDSDAYKVRADGIVDPGSVDRHEMLCVTEMPKALREDTRSRVVRGGSWGGDAGGCRSACRDWRRPDDGFDLRGFRVCLVPGPVTRDAERK